MNQPGLAIRRQPEIQPGEGGLPLAFLCFLFFVFFNYCSCWGSTLTPLGQKMKCGFMQKSAWLYFSASTARALDSSTASSCLQGPGSLVCLTGPLSPFHCEFHGSQVVPGLDSFLSDLAVNIDAWLGPRLSR